jgi:hypothetical protein
MRNERESKGGLPSEVQRVTLGDPVTPTDCNPACYHSDCFTPEDGTDTLSRNVGKLPTYGAFHKSEGLATVQRKPSVSHVQFTARCSGSPQYRTFSSLHGAVEALRIARSVHCTAPNSSGDNAAAARQVNAKRVSKFDSSTAVCNGMRPAFCFPLQSDRGFDSRSRHRPLCALTCGLSCRRLEMKRRRTKDPL